MRIVKGKIPAASVFGASYMGWLTIVAGIFEQPVYWPIIIIGCLLSLLSFSQEYLKYAITTNKLYLYAYVGSLFILSLFIIFFGIGAIALSIFVAIPLYFKAIKIYEQEE
jgi:hypothetical protein